MLNIIGKIKPTFNNMLLLLILVLSTLLRFWNYSDIPFIHDELSVMARTEYKSVKDVIYDGVAIKDAHPAGVQVFIYYWIKLFGSSEMSVKLPFTLAGIFSLLIAYLFAKKWFNATVGLITVSFMAISQYLITYSQLAKQYSFGLFFSLLMVWFWSNYLFNATSKRKTIQLIGYVIFSALCAYTHYFSFLFAIIVGASGLFYLRKDNWKQYFLAAFFVFIIYLPHLGIFFFHLGKGGLGGPENWLGEPDKLWLLQYLKYIFNYSVALLLLLGVLMFLGFTRFKNHFVNKKMKYLSLMWFVVLFLVEYLYSLIVSPVIQFSSLTFAYPFLLIFLFSSFADISNKYKLIIVTLVLFVGSFSLIYSRKHYQIFYKLPFEEQVKFTFKALDYIGDDTDCSIYIFSPPKFSDYYFKKYNRKFIYTYFDSYSKIIDTKGFRSFVYNQKTNYFITDGVPLEYFEIIKEKYPYVIFQEDGFTYSIKCFSKRKTDECFRENILFEKEYKGEIIDSLDEFGNSFKIPLKQLINDRHSIIQLSANIYCNQKSANPILVIDLENDGHSFNWFGAKYLNFNNVPNDYNTVYLSVDITNLKVEKYSNPVLKFYVWNKDKNNVLIKDFRLKITEGNHLIYSLFEPID